MELVDKECERIKRAYQDREQRGWGLRYSWYQKGTLYVNQERERILLSMLERALGDLSDKRILDIGCGRGSTLIPFMLYGASAQNCFGVDILEDRIKTARKNLPGMTFVCCSAENIPFQKGTFDLVTLFTCLSSVLDRNIRRRICTEAIAMLRPCGWVLVYDFTISNPWNPDVKALRLNELKEYFPGCKFISKRLTLLPPLARFLGPYSIALCGMLSAIPLLKTHRMTMFQKPR